MAGPPAECHVQAGKYPSGRVNVAIAVADEARASIYQVAAACRALGFRHTSTLLDVGVLTGTVDVHAVLKLKAVPGVVAVELARGSRA